MTGMADVKYRDAVTGEYVTEEYAKEHPDTTVAETDPMKDEREFSDEEIAAPDD